MPRGNGIVSRITRAFLFQGALVAVAAILGVFFAKIVIEEILIKNAILEESEYFWNHYQSDPNFNLPDTKNLTGFFDTDRLPDFIRQELPAQPGFYEYDNGGDRLVLYLDPRFDRMLYLLYYRGQVDTLVLYYGLFPLLVVLVLLYLSVWLTYRISRRTVSPIIRLARQINDLDFSRKHLTVRVDDTSLVGDDEIQVLSEAINQLGDRLGSYVARERNFTRDASHELRSPLTVINIAADMLLSEQELSPPAQKSVERIKRSIGDMEKLTEVFLMLARENDQALTRDRISVNQVLREEIDRARLVNRNENIEIRYAEQNGLELNASDMVISVLLGNLIRNALLYTEQGVVEARIEGQSVLITDSGKGMTPQQLENMFEPFRRGENVNASGYGIGLTIVKRLTERFNWPIEVSSELNKGTAVRLNFTEGRVFAL